MGSDQQNDVLSLQRAERVRQELVRLGIDPDRIQTVGRGEREPLVPTDDEVRRAAQSAGGDHRPLIARAASAPFHRTTSTVRSSDGCGAGGEARHVLTDRLADLADAGRR